MRERDENWEACSHSGKMTFIQLSRSTNKNGVRGATVNMQITCALNRRCTCRERYLRSGADVVRSVAIKYAVKKTKKAVSAAE